MIRLDLNRQDHWLDLCPGVRVHVHPMGSAIWMMAKLDDAVIAAQAEGQAAFTVALIKAIAARAIFAWEGVGDLDGTPILPDREAVLALMDLHAPYEAFNRDYVGPWLLLSAEKNGSAPLPGGGSAGALPTADTAPTSVPPVPSGTTSP